MAWYYPWTWGDDGEWESADPHDPNVRKTPEVDSPFVDALNGGADAVGDLITDPTGAKAASADQMNILQQQMQLGQANWDNYLSRFGAVPEYGSYRAFDFLNTPTSTPDPTRYRPNLQAQNYYNPDAQRYNANLQAGDYYGPQAERYRPNLQAQNYYGPQAQQWQSQLQGNQNYYGPQAQQYQFDPFSVQADPGYQFALGEGQKAISQNAAAGSGILGPDTQKELAKYSTGLASQYANDAFGRWQQTQGMNQGAARDYRADQMGNANQMWGIDTGANDRGNQYAQQYRADQMGNQAMRYGVDTGITGMDYGMGQDYFANQMAGANQRFGVDTGLTNMDNQYFRDFRADQTGNQAMRYGVDTGLTAMDYGMDKDYYNNQVGQSMNNYNMGLGRANFGMNALAMTNPLGFTGQQANLAGGLADARGNAGGPAIWDWLNLGVEGAKAAGSIFGGSK